MLPVPQSDDERALCLRMAQIALNSDCRPTLAEGDVSLGGAVLSLSERCDIPKSTESAFALTLSFGEERAAYVTSWYFDAPEAFREQTKDFISGTLIAGTHGKPGVCVPPDGSERLSDKDFTAVWKK